MAGESARDRALRAREKAERLARYAERWEKGAAGESQTAAALSRLGAGWICWHDLKWPGRRLSNIDHIAIGPGGVFVIDSKNWSGRVEVKNGVLRQNGYQRESAVAGCADSALAVGELVPNYLDAVKPVLCFVGDASPEGWARDVMLCSTSNLVEMLASRPRLLNESQVAQVADVLSQRMTAMPSSAIPTSRKSRSPEAVAAAPFHIDAQPAPQVRSRLPTFFIGLGVWFCFMVVIGAALSALPAHSDTTITPAALVAAIASWLLARRIRRKG
jgi:hypothetical protein